MPSAGLCAAEETSPCSATTGRRSSPPPPPPRGSDAPSQAPRWLAAPNSLGPGRSPPGPPPPPTGPPARPGLPAARRSDRAKRAHADELISFLGLGDVADRFVNELSTGTRRVVELACLVATGARVLCLDEPTAGLAQTEAEAFPPLLLDVQRQLDASVLLIEHDMSVAMNVCTRLYCLEAGRIISEGQPHEIRADERVIESSPGAGARSGRLEQVTRHDQEIKSSLP